MCFVRKVSRKNRNVKWKGKKGGRTNVLLVFVKRGERTRCRIEKFFSFYKGSAVTNWGWGRGEGNLFMGKRKIVEFYNRRVGEGDELFTGEGRRGGKEPNTSLHDIFTNEKEKKKEKW